MSTHTAAALPTDVPAEDLPQGVISTPAESSPAKKDKDRKEALRRDNEQDYKYFYHLAGWNTRNPPAKKKFDQLRERWDSTKEAIRRKSPFSTTNQKELDTDSHSPDNDRASDGGNSTSLNTADQSGDHSLGPDVTLQSGYRGGSFISHRGSAPSTT